MSIPTVPAGRTVLFISKATPGDDEFALWLAPRLEAAGYAVFADILSLDAADRWRKEITNTLQERAVKMLLCCSDTTLAREGVHEEIGIASDLARQLNDPKFIIPLRLAPFKKVFGIGELQYIDFVRGWAAGLDKLLGTLKRQGVLPDKSKVQINPNWEAFRLRSTIALRDEPERLTSNWLRAVEIPDVIRYFQPTGAIDHFAMYDACAKSPFPAEPYLHGFFAFGTEAEVNESLATAGKFVAAHEIELTKFVADGSIECDVKRQVASNFVHSMLRQAWNSTCRSRGLLEYQYSKAIGFHATEEQAKIGQKVSWGKQGEKRSSMLRNVARGVVWQFGVSAHPTFWPYPHFKLKSRALFAPPKGDEADNPFDDPKKQHRLRRTICKGWRNKQWHGRLMAFCELLSGDSSFIRLALSNSVYVKLDATPIVFTSPVSTALPNILTDDEEEQDISTLGRPEPEEDAP